MIFHPIPLLCGAPPLEMGEAIAYNSARNSSEPVVGLRQINRFWRFFRLGSA
jgi:hypothetical protein